jgi:hypothetical protein
MTCAFIACENIAVCPLIGGCVNREQRRWLPLDRTPRTQPLYNVHGLRLDLHVEWEESGVAEARWQKARRVYQQKLDSQAPDKVRA